MERLERMARDSLVAGVLHNQSLNLTGAAFRFCAVQCSCSGPGKLACAFDGSRRAQMENPGERLVGDYLRYVKGCDFVDFNVYTTATQGEIDVIGVALATKEAYICEVVTHLTTGIQYVKNKRPDTADRLIKKFLKDIHYGTEAFGDYAVRYMLWSPVVRRSHGKPEYDQFAHLRRVDETV